VSNLKEFPAFLRYNVVDEVVICLPMKSFYQEASEIVVACEEQGVIVRVLSDFFNLKTARSTTTHFEGESITSLYTGSMVGPSAFIKRILDIVFSLVMIIILSPLFSIVALLIKLTSPGPVFFVQERLGLNKRRIGVFKFRTMVPDAENKQAELEHLNEVSGPVFKIKNDPRITPIGRFLRKSSIDELPQLFNVLKGDMSLVGPRPLPVRDYQGFDQDWHRRRFSVRPGITCLWQISGRCGISFDRWMELDMEYIDNWSLGLDIRILAKTIPAVLKGSGAA
jgi:exopolysaccharide biosynthesis polyprenyl glycosylphosphotransferase